ncbi:MAG TPA: RNA polymerase sigma factor [Bacteroidales bacterium]|nr:RNA polymerase sigma factor [Bacteroidales bacterium]
MTQIEFSHKLVSLRNNLEYYANMLTSNREEAKDLLQDTFLKALSNRDKFASDTNLKAWTYTIMKNTFINNYRRNQKANTIVDSTEDLFYLNIARKSDFPSPESRISEKEINKTISNLDEDQRMPFEMHNAGYKYKEIADHLNISIGTVKSRIFFTRRKLMDSLKDFAD